jgi:hypothetical protein
MTTWVFVECNRRDKPLPELISRFVDNQSIWTNTQAYEASGLFEYRHQQTTCKKYLNPII